MTGRYWVETLGCPKNQVDSDKLAGTLLASGMTAATNVAEADVVVVNTCAFIESARAESVEVILDLASARRRGARLVVTGCLAERYGSELAESLPEVDLVAGFGVPITLGVKPSPVAADRGFAGAGIGEPKPLGADIARLDLLNLPRPRSAAPWAYVKVAEGCDRACGFCAIPSFRGRQRSRSVAAVLGEVEALEVAEVVLVAQDLASYGRDDGRPGAIVDLVGKVSARVPRTRLLYLYPSDLGDALVEAICATGVAYFDLSLQHASGPLLRRMRRWGDGEKFRRRIESIRSREPVAAFRSSFIVGYPGETAADHEALVEFLEDVRLDWAGFFTYSAEEGTYAAGLDGAVDPSLITDRLAELSAIQEDITAAKRAALVGSRVEVLVDSPGVGRTHREAPEIDGVVLVPDHLSVGSLEAVTIGGLVGLDLEAA
ncbi:MAG: MiaB/RimO family radical SAM methylthiotransferase [Acidimicrobiales bacterium]